MIRLNRLNETEILVNENFIEIAEEAPDTVISMQNSHRFTVKETVNEILEMSLKSNPLGRFARLTRLNDTVILVNLNFVELAEEVPDTVITMQNSHRYTVKETVDEILTKSEKYKKGIFD